MPERALAIVAAASENHAPALFHLLESLDRHERGTPVLVYDIGLSRASRKKLRRQRRNVVDFRFADYPPHVDPNQLRTYAWKPAIVREVMLAHGLPLLWLDAGDLVHGPLRALRAALAQDGFLSLPSSDNIRTWCHPAAIEALRVEPEILDARNYNAAIVGFGDSALGRTLVQDWYEAAMRPEIICPPGATTTNHRFDQAILSVLLTRAARARGIAMPTDRYNVSIHNDKITTVEARRYMRIPPHPDNRKERRRILDELRPINRMKRAVKRALSVLKRMVAWG